MNSIQELIETVARLRAPNGCPWDKEQTHETLKRYLIEETYETIDAIESKNPHALMEELGDVLLQVVLHSQIASENKEFSIKDVASHINKKMIARHPHVFSNAVVNSTDEVLINWEKIKKEEKPERKEILDGIPKSLPALLKALKVSKKVAKNGFDWEKESDIWDVLKAEISEFKNALMLNKKKEQEEELGDILFTVVNLARWYKLDPELSLNSAIQKFIKRYNKVNQLILSSKRKTDELSVDELNKLWDKVKKEEKA